MEKVIHLLAEPRDGDAKFRTGGVSMVAASLLVLSDEVEESGFPSVMDRRPKLGHRT